MNTFTLNNGIKIPALGFGVYQIPPGVETERAVVSALEIGYRHIDTAAFYKNEADVGRAIRASGIPRPEIFVTTKLFPTTIFNVEKSFFESLKKLHSGYVDLYLIHWPFLRKINIWKILEKLYAQGYIKAIGVSNYRIQDVEKILEGGTIVPAVNQVEFHPFLYRKELLSYSQSKNIILEAHSPLTHGKHLQDSRLLAIGETYGKSVAQILIRWSLQHGLVVIPKTLKKDRMKENIDVFDFEISSEDMLTLDNLNTNEHIAGLSRIVGH